MTVDKDRLIKKLEHVGEHMVRENLEKGVYGPNRRGLVEEWLEQFEVNDEAEQLPEDVREDDAGAGALATEPSGQSKESKASEPREIADESPPRKWYQRLLKKWAT